MTGAAQDIFEPEHISNGNVFTGGFAPDGDALYFFKKVAEVGEEYQIYRTVKNEEGKFSPPEELPALGDFSNLYPVITSDGKRMVYASYRPTPSKEKKNAYIWVMDKDESGHWTKPRYIANINTPGYYHSNLSLTKDDDIVFRRLTPDYRNRTTFIAKKVGRGYADPVLYEPVEQWRELGDTLMLVGGQPTPFENLVVLAVRPVNHEIAWAGKAQKWYSIKTEAGWQTPKPCKGVNRESRSQNFAIFSPSGLDMYVTRDMRAIYHFQLRSVLGAEDFKLLKR